MPRPRIYIQRTLADYPAPTPQPTPCRLWQGRVDAFGYGVRPDETRMHIWVWKQIHGPVPKGKCVLHHCDNPPCYRYDHLWLGTKADNYADMVAKGRRGRGLGGRRHAGQDHPMSKLTEQDVRDILARPDIPARTLASEYGVHRTTIVRIRTGTRWCG